MRNYSDVVSIITGIVLVNIFGIVCWILGYIINK